MGDPCGNAKVVHLDYVNLYGTVCACVTQWCCVWMYPTTVLYYTVLHNVPIRETG